MESFKAFCTICEKELTFESADDYWSCRSDLRSPDCSYGSCATRERAIGSVLLGIVPREALQGKIIYESSPAMRGFSLWLKKNCPKYHPTGFFINQPFGSMVNGIMNENLEQLTLPDESVDIWLHLDVLEHLFHPFLALSEIFRTLKVGGGVRFYSPDLSWA